MEEPESPCDVCGAGLYQAICQWAAKPGEAQSLFCCGGSVFAEGEAWPGFLTWTDCSKTPDFTLKPVLNRRTFAVFSYFQDALHQARLLGVQGFSGIVVASQAGHEVRLRESFLELRTPYLEVRGKSVPDIAVTASLQGIMGFACYRRCCGTAVFASVFDADLAATTMGSTVRTADCVFGLKPIKLIWRLK